MENIHSFGKPSMMKEVSLKRFYTGLWSDEIILDKNGDMNSKWEWKYRQLERNKVKKHLHTKDTLNKFSYSVQPS